ncbi:MAG: glutamate racemase [Bacteroidota bacterium]
MTKNRNEFPIGMFDSGVGGTSILKEIRTTLPNEDVIYLSDSKNAPYGEKSLQEIIDLSIKNTEFLLEKGAKLIVVACNTATTNAIEILRKKYKLPFIGIEPAIKPATLQTRNKRIGILATKGTLSSELFHKTCSTVVKNDIQIIEIVGKGLVEAVEANRTNDKDFITNLENQLHIFKDKDVDSLVLGCTHFPYLIPQIKRFLPDIKIIDSGKAVAKQTKTMLKKHQLINKKNSPGLVNFYSNGNLDVLKSLVNPYNKEKLFNIKPI